MAPVRLERKPHQVRRGCQLPEGRVDAENLHEVIRNLDGLSMGVPPHPMREIPTHMQQQTIGVPKQFLVPL